MSRRVAALVLLAACSAPQAGQPPPRAPKAQEAQEVKDVTARDFKMPALPHGRVVVKDVYGGKHALDVELALTPEARTRGLMWRTELAAGKGMLFVFAEQEEHSFWMRNTLIPLDMVFISADRHVVGVVSRAEPKTLTGRSVGKPSLYVLEVPGGWCESVGIAIGSVVEMTDVPAVKE